MTDIYTQRLGKLKTFLKKEGCDGLIVDDRINLYYLTGLDLSAGKLIIDSKDAHLLVDNRYYELCKNKSPFPVILSKGNKTLVDFFSSSDQAMMRTLGFNSHNTSYDLFVLLQKEIEEINNVKKQNIELRAIENPVAKLRCLKDSHEINILREAAKLGSQGFDYLITLLKNEITEAELAVELEIFWKRKGGKAVAFDPIIAFGANSSMPHYRVGAEKLKPGSSILIDIGVNYEHYHSDMTRVVYYGEPDPKLLAIHQIVQNAQQAALHHCRPGTKIGDLDKSARDVISKEGYGENFTHSLGHGVGLEIHEIPTIRNSAPTNEMPLEEGMVITIEPGIYIPGIGGVRIEDTIVITDSGYENLTKPTKDPVTIKPA